MDNDPLVLAHARALLASDPSGGTDYIEADLYDPGALVSIARTKLDFGEPVAIMLMGVMGLELADPGVVPIHQWRPDPAAADAPEVPALGGVGKKP